jgi:hypothetical protein
VIEDVGSDVSRDRIGETVVVTLVPSCGACRFCIDGLVNLCTEGVKAFETGLLRDGTTRIRWKGQEAYHLQFVSSFEPYSPSSIPTRVLAVLFPERSFRRYYGVARRFSTEPSGPPLRDLALEAGLWTEDGDDGPADE